MANETSGICDACDRPLVKKPGRGRRQSKFCCRACNHKMNAAWRSLGREIYEAGGIERDDLFSPVGGGIAP
jgi:hypothetical protein